jgi:hypothetical protein
MTYLVSLAALISAASILRAQTGAETFTATAAVKAGGGAAATAPVTIVVNRKLSQTEVDTLRTAFNSGGAAGLRKALAGSAASGSIQLGPGAPTPARFVIERTTDNGRLLTVVADQPILHLGGGLPAAQAKQGYDFAVADIQIDAKGMGSGTLAPAAKVTLKDGAFVVEDYGAELIQLTGVSRK